MRALTSTATRSASSGSPARRRRGSRPGSPPPTRWKGGNWMASGRMPWAPRMLCAVPAAIARVIEHTPETASAAVRAVVNAQRALKSDVGLATKVGRALFPPAEAELIAGVGRDDLLFYDATISPAAIAGLNRFAQATGLLEEAVDYDALVATQFRHLWMG